YSTAAERAFTGGAAGLGQFVRFAGPLALVWAGRSFVRTRGGCSYRWGDAFDCRSTASVRSEGKPIHRACLIRTRGGCSYRVGVTRSIVGAPPRCEPSQTNTPSPSVRTRGGCSYRVGVARWIVGAPPRCEAKANQYTEPALFAPGAGAPTGVARK